MKLTIRTPGRDRRVVTIERPGIVIGRSSSCDVVVRERSVSSRHVQILAGPVAIDLGSTNGTFVEGRRIDDVTPLPATGGRLCLGGPDDVVIDVDAGAASSPLSSSPPSGTKDPEESSVRLEDALAVYLQWKDHGLESPEELYARHPELREPLEAMIAEDPASDGAAPAAPPPEEQVLRALDRILGSPDEAEVGVYALGAVLHLLCTGVLPTPPNRRALSEGSLDGVRNDLVQLIQRALDPVHERRFETQDELTRAFQTIVAKKGGLLDRLRG